MELPVDIPHPVRLHTRSTQSRAGHEHVGRVAGLAYVEVEAVHATWNHTDHADYYVRVRLDRADSAEQVRVISARIYLDALTIMDVGGKGIATRVLRRAQDEIPHPNLERTPSPDRRRTASAMGLA